MNHLGTKELSTERLLLRAFKSTDGDAMYKNYAHDSDVTKYLTWPTHSSPNISRYICGIWEQEAKKKDSYQWAIVLKEKNEVIGSISLIEIKEETMSCEIGYCIGKAFWGQGYTVEAGKALFEFLFNEVGFNRICAKYDSNNTNSGKVMEKLGMHFEGIERQSAKNNQGIYDAVVYSLIKDEYKG